MKSAQPAMLLTISLVGLLLLFFQISPMGATLDNLIQGTQETTALADKQPVLVEPITTEPAAPSQVFERTNAILTPTAAAEAEAAPAALPEAPEEENAAVPASGGVAMTIGAEAGVGEISPAVSALDRAGSSQFKSFVERVSNGQGEVVRGVYVEGVFELPVIQQPGGNAAFVSEKKATVTQFQSAREYGVTGLLAHNFLSGLEFYNLQVGQIVRVVYGDSSIRSYQITELVQYQKLSPSNLRSDLIDLATGEQVTSETVFARVYRGKHHLTFQTCLERNGVSNWGLSFWIATPVEAGF